MNTPKTATEAIENSIRSVQADLSLLAVKSLALITISNMIENSVDDPVLKDFWTEAKNMLSDEIAGLQIMATELAFLHNKGIIPKHGIGMTIHTEDNLNFSLPDLLHEFSYQQNKDLQDAIQSLSDTLSSTAETIFDCHKALQDAGYGVPCDTSFTNLLPTIKIVLNDAIRLIRSKELIQVMVSLLERYSNGNNEIYQFLINDYRAFKSFCDEKPRP